MTTVYAVESNGALTSNYMIGELRNIVDNIKSIIGYDFAIAEQYGSNSGYDLSIMKSMYRIMQRQSDIFMTLSPVEYELAGYYTDQNKTIFNDIGTLQSAISEIKNSVSNGDENYVGALMSIVGYTEAKEQGMHLNANSLLQRLESLTTYVNGYFNNNTATVNNIETRLDSVEALTSNAGATLSSYWLKSPEYDLGSHTSLTGVRWFHGQESEPIDTRVYVRVFDPNSLEGILGNSYVYPITSRNVQTRTLQNSRRLEVWFDNPEEARILDTTRALDPLFGNNRRLFVRALFAPQLPSAETGSLDVVTSAEVSDYL